MLKSFQKPLLLVSFSCLLVFNGCKLFYLPAYNAQISEQIDNTSNTVDKFFTMMLETTTAENNGRAYALFDEQYMEIEAKLNSLYILNNTRPLNEISTHICENTLQLWVKYKEVHKKDNTISNGLIKLNQKIFSDLFIAMQIAEKAKGLISK